MEPTPLVLPMGNLIKFYCYYNVPTKCQLHPSWLDGLFNHSYNKLFTPVTTGWILLHQHVFVFSSHPFWTSSSLDVPAGVTQEEGHTGFLIHLPSAVRALIFVARRIQPFLSLVDREVEFCVLTTSAYNVRIQSIKYFTLHDDATFLSGASGLLPAIAVSAQLLYN